MFYLTWLCLKLTLNFAGRRFTEEEIRRIQALTIYDIIMSVTDMDDGDIQRDPFKVLMQGELIGRRQTLKVASDEINKSYEATTQLSQ